MSKILQFKISLKGSRPLIWRRFQADDILKFYDLHLIIQTLMGWENIHLYQFVYKKYSYIGNPELLEDDETIDDKKIKLSDIFDKPKTSVSYEYDFGDDWQHKVQLEKILEKDPKQYYPVCIKGAFNCPPEDCGGIEGFYELLEIVQDRNNPDYEDSREWLGEYYDPEYFNLDLINESLQSYKDTDPGLIKIS
ncbi:MAG: plasmid pRiA4b ORF-3 family protein [Ignavibacteria bacterium]|nr:plasmid pRiA4b ORF-3 family protein [Ignavibacteria bacterium]